MKNEIKVAQCLPKLTLNECCKKAISEYKTIFFCDCDNDNETPNDLAFQAGFKAGVKSMPKSERSK